MSSENNQVAKIEHEQTSLTVQQQQVNHANKLIEMAVQNDVDMDKFERLLDMQKQIKADIAREQFFENLSKFQSEIPAIKKRKKASFDTRNGGKMEYSFASLDDITESIKPYLKKYGISYRFEQTVDNGLITVSCLVMCCGHTETTSFPALADTSGNKNGIQQMASTVTYLRRYTLTGALGITTADDDIDGRLPERPGDEVKFYDEESFEANFPQWEKLIKSGKKSADGIVKFIEAKGGALTDEQINKLKNINQEEVKDDASN